MAGPAAEPANAAEPAAAAAPDLEPAAFEPERAFPDAPAAFEADDFFEREIGILSEQGNLERARVQLSRRVAAHGDDVQLYLDAIRMERSAARGGESWQAWLVRGLAAGVQLAAQVRVLVPADELGECLVHRDIGFTVLERQRDAAALRELLRLRWERLLESDPNAALACVEEPALQRAAAHDPALGRLALGVLAGAVWRNPERVAGIAPRYGVTLAAGGGAAGEPGRRAPASLLERAYRLRAVWRALVEQAECPPPLERFVRLGRLLSVDQTRRLLGALHTDLRVRPREYLRCADAIARQSPALWQWLADGLRDARSEALAAPGAHAGDKAEEQRDAIERRLQAAADAARADRLGRLWQVALGLSSVACALAAFAAAAAGTRYLAGVLAIWTPLLLVLWPLHRRVDALRYVRTVRPALLDLVALNGLALDELAARMLHAPQWTLRRLAKHAAADRALTLISSIVRSAPRAER